MIPSIIHPHFTIHLFISSSFSPLCLPPFSHYHSHYMKRIPCVPVTVHVPLISMKLTTTYPFKTKVRGIMDKSGHKLPWGTLRLTIEINEQRSGSMAESMTFIKEFTCLDPTSYPLIASFHPFSPHLSVQRRQTDPGV